MWRRLWLDEQGNQIVEFALIAPILIFLVLSVPILGMTVRAWLVAEGAAREGARVVAITSDMGAACDRAYQEVTVYGRLPTQRGNDVLFDRHFIKVNPSEGEVMVEYRQPTFVPGLPALLGGEGWGDAFVVVGKARFVREKVTPVAGGLQSC